jgi:hypothetical protein
MPDDDLYADVRRLAVVVLVITTAVLVLIDALSPVFTIDPIVLGMIISGALLFADISSRLTK